MHHQFDVIDVNPAGGDVGGHQDTGLSGAERSQVAVAGRLGEVAVQIHRGDARLGELLGQLARLMFGAQEQDSPPGSRSQGVDQLALGLGAGDVEYVVGHRRDGGVTAVHRMRHLIAQEAVDELVDTVVQGGREQQPLAAGRGGGQDPGDAGEETEVCHVIGLVDHGDLDRVQADELLAHQVFEPPRAGDDDVDAGLQRSLLTGLRHAAEDGGDGQSVGLRQWGDRRGDLGGQFAGGCEHQTGRTARNTLVSSQAGNQRDGERQGLPAAGLAPAKHVAAGQGVGQGLNLNRERVGEAVGDQRLHQRCRHAEIGEGGFGGHDLCAFRASGVRIGTVVARLPGGKIFSPRDKGCRSAALITRTGPTRSTELVAGGLNVPRRAGGESPPASSQG